MNDQPWTEMSFNIPVSFVEKNKFSTSADNLCKYFGASLTNHCETTILFKIKLKGGHNSINNYSKETYSHLWFSKGSLDHLSPPPPHPSGSAHVTKI